MSANAEPIERLVFEAQRLVTEHPPVLRHPNKQLLFQIACPPGSVHGGHLTYTRWAAMPLPGRCDPAAAARCAEERRGFYDYLPAPGHEGAVEWHVNFADPNLFVAYGSALFAQDEMQVAEHPALGSLREALPAGSRRALTVEGGRPTPALVMGVERLLRDQEASDAFHAARELLSVTLAAGGAVSTPALIQQVAGVGFRWGTSDGN